MNFLTTPLTFTRDQRTSRDVCRDACAIERPAPRKFDAHQVVAAGLRRRTRLPRSSSRTGEIRMSFEHTGFHAPINLDEYGTRKVRAGALPLPSTPRSELHAAVDFTCYGPVRKLPRPVKTADEITEELMARLKRTESTYTPPVRAPFIYGASLALVLGIAAFPHLLNATMSTALATQQGGALTLTDDELIVVLQSSLYPGAAVASVKMVLGYCRAAGLDPMKKPVHIVPMWDSKAKQMRDVIMPGVGMYRTDAARTGAFAGQTEPEFGPMVTAKLGGVEITYPEWARVTVKKIMTNGSVAEFTAVEYWIENYAVKGGQEKSIAPNAMWTKRPRGQIAKCAAAQALRLAFPEGGAQPTAEEMEGKSINDFQGTTIDADTGEVSGGKASEKKAALPGYTDEQFASHMVTWTKILKAGKKDVDGVLATVATVATLTEAQIKTIRNIPAELAKVEQQKTAGAEAGPAAGAADALPPMVYADVADALTAAKTKPELDAAAALIDRVSDAAFREELKGMHAELADGITQ